MFSLYGYTLNRITLFALIFSIGILVDDAIVVVENVVRHHRLPENRERPFREVAIEAVDEVGNPTILATLTVIAAILPMAFVGGLMGPYMRPIPVGATFAMLFSLLVAFIVTPWASMRLLRRKAAAGDQHHPEKEDWSVRLYRKFMNPLIHRPLLRWIFLGGVVLLLLLSFLLVLVGWVKVKMLPFDNKSEFQVIIDMPETATLERTANLALEMGDHLSTVNEVLNFQIYAGTASPMNFNGLVRHYFLRRGPNVADIQVNLVEKGRRKVQSHEIAKRVRPPLQKIAERYGGRVKIAEVPPGPPVLSTLVAEIYGPDYERQREIARDVERIFEETAGVVDVDRYMEKGQEWFEFAVDKEKAALHGISAAQIDKTVRMALKGETVGLIHDPREKEDVPMIIRLPLEDRSGVRQLAGMKMLSRDGSLVALSDLVSAGEIPMDRSIYHKNLMPVVYSWGMWPVSRRVRSMPFSRCRGKSTKLHSRRATASSSTPRAYREAIGNTP